MHVTFLRIDGVVLCPCTGNPGLGADVALGADEVEVGAFQCGSDDERAVGGLVHTEGDFFVLSPDFIARHGDTLAQGMTADEAVEAVVVGSRAVGDDVASARAAVGAVVGLVVGEELVVGLGAIEDDCLLLHGGAVDVLGKQFVGGISHVLPTVPRHLHAVDVSEVVEVHPSGLDGQVGIVRLSVRVGLGGEGDAVLLHAGGVETFSVGAVGRYLVEAFNQILDDRAVLPIFLKVLEGVIDPHPHAMRLLVDEVVLGEDAVEGVEEADQFGVEGQVLSLHDLVAVPCVA